MDGTAGVSHKWFIYDLVDDHLWCIFFYYFIVIKKNIPQMVINHNILVLNDSILVLNDCWLIMKI